MGSSPDPKIKRKQQYTLKFKYILKRTQCKDCKPPARLIIIPMVVIGVMVAVALSYDYISLHIKNSLHLSVEPYFAMLKQNVKKNSAYESESRLNPKVLTIVCCLEAFSRHLVVLEVTSVT